MLIARGILSIRYPVCAWNEIMYDLLLEVRFYVMSLEVRIRLKPFREPGKSKSNNAARQFFAGKVSRPRSHTMKKM